MWAERNLEDPIRPYLQRLFHEERVEECLWKHSGKLWPKIFNESVPNVHALDEEVPPISKVGKVMAHLREHTDQKKVTSTHEAIYEDYNLAPLEECIMEAYGT